MDIRFAPSVVLAALVGTEQLVGWSALSHPTMFVRAVGC